MITVSRGSTRPGPTSTAPTPTASGWASSNSWSHVVPLRRVPSTKITRPSNGLSHGAAIIERLPAEQRSRVGVCVDTCHVYSAGYDLVQDYDGVMRHFDDVLGLDRLRVVHLNDSKTPFASRRDRHELIAEGSLGEVPFRRMMTDERLFSVPKVIETPKLDDATATDARMLARLRSYGQCA